MYVLYNLYNFIYYLPCNKTCNDRLKAPALLPIPTLTCEYNATSILQLLNVQASLAMQIVLLSA